MDFLSFINYTHLKIIIACIFAVGFGVIAGSAAVMVFNRLPGHWFLDWNDLPGGEGSAWRKRETWDESLWDDKKRELIHPTRQRLTSTPWKYVFTGLFITFGIPLALSDMSYALPALVAIWLLLLMSVSDIKYMIVPDQLIMMLLITGIGFLTSGNSVYEKKGSILQPFFPDHHIPQLWDSLAGLGFAFLTMIFMMLLSVLVYKQVGIGGADLKLYSVLGFLTGLGGFAFIFVVATLLSSAHFILLLARKKTELKEHRPVVPYIALGAAVYFLYYLGF